MKFMHKIKCYWEYKSAFAGVLRGILLSRTDKSSLTPFVFTMKNFSGIFGLAFIVLAATLFLPVAEVHAFPANQCAADRYGSDLGCTAGDVSITGMSVVGETTSCVGGTPITLDLQMDVNFAVPDRWDIGIFISNDGKDPQVLAANGGAASCTASVLPTSSPFLNLDGGATGDTCGDGNGSIGGGTGKGVHYMSNVTVPCQSLAGAGGSLYIPFVVSWDNKASPSGSLCTSNADPVPNTKSKCNSPTIVQGSVAVVVLPTITKTDSKTTIFSGDSTSYTVTITNTTGAVLSGAVFKDPAVSGIAVSTLSCAASGASCPASSTVVQMQGAGIAIPDMPVAGSVTFTIGATLTGNPGETRSNAATVTVNGQTNKATDIDTIVDVIAILPTSQSQNGTAGSTVTYTYTLYNFGIIPDTITLSAASGSGWTAGVSPTSVSVPAGGSTAVTVTVTVPAGASIGNVDSTTITATSGNFPIKTATATAVTTVTAALTLIPGNAGSGGAGSFVYYNHRVQSNVSTSKVVSLVPSFTGGACTGWSSALFERNKTTPLSSPVTLTANGGYKDFVLRVFVSAGAAAGASCTATLTAQYTSGTPSTVSVTDITATKNLLLYEDPGYTRVQSVYPTGKNVYAKTYGLNAATNYEYRWYDSAGTEVCLPRQSSTSGTTFPSTCAIPVAGPFGTWTVQVWNTTAGTKFVESLFYVGPDHINASYSGANPPVASNAVINLALHDKYNHVVPFDPFGNLVKGDPANPDGPLKITVTLSGSAQIVSTTLVGAVITGQTVTGKLSSTTGTATLTITDSIQETVTVSPGSYNGLLWGSPGRDESTTVTFFGSVAPHHLEIQHASGTGVTCTPGTLTIKACANAAVPCTPYTAGVSGTLSKTGLPTVNWTGGTGFTIASGSSTVTKNVQVTTPGNVVFGATSTPAATTATSCNFGAPSCTFTASDAGFVVTAPNHAAETNSTLTVQAVKKADNSLACVPAFASTSKSVNLKCSYTNPVTGTLPVRVAGAALNATNSTAAACDAAGANLSLAFNASGIATPSLQYADVGQMSIAASFTGTAGVLDAGLVMTGSGTFISAPASFGFSAVTAGTIKAGDPFSATVTARNVAGNATPNFGKESSPEGVTLGSNLVSPVGGSNPPLVNNAIAGGAFSNGIATVTNLSWGEVGNIDLTADLSSGDYLTSGVVAATGTSATVGPFIPHHLDTAVVATFSTPMPCPAGLTCPALFDGFIYSGQAFSLRTTARNLAGGTITNYDATLGFSRAVTLTAWDALGSLTAPAGAGTLTGAIPAGAFSAGVATTATPTYTFATATTPPSDIYIRALDSDSASSRRATPANSVEGGVKVASGRIYISNAHGSELLPLPMTATVQFYDAVDSWVTSTTDSDTPFNTNLSTAGGNIVSTILSGLAGGLSVATPGAMMVNAGVLNFTFNAPGAEGSSDISMNTPNYLLGGSNGAGVNPSSAARVTFGIFKGSKHVIYIREVY